MANQGPFDIDRLFEGALRRLNTEAEYFSRLTGHNPELGRLNETHLVQLLRTYLPPKFGIGTGFIACGGENPRQSPQCDIILYDALNNSPLYQSDSWSIYPIEMVYGVIEVKTRLTPARLAEAFAKCAFIRQMVRGRHHPFTNPRSGNKAYAILVPQDGKAVAKYQLWFDSLAPRFFVFGYNGWSKPTAFASNFRKVSAANRDAHIHGVCNLYPGGSFYMSHRAFKKNEDRYSEVYDNGFGRFLMNLPFSLNSMLRPEGFGMGFDQTYLKHYELPVEIEVEA